MKAEETKGHTLGSQHMFEAIHFFNSKKDRVFALMEPTVLWGYQTEKKKNHKNKYIITNCCSPQKKIQTALRLS